MKIILASQSQFRKHAMDVLGLQYEIIPSNINESAIRHEDFEQMAKMLSEAKCREVAETQKDAIIVAADLFVVCENNIFEKPKDKQEAEEMLKTFSENKVKMISGLAVMNSKTQDLSLACESSNITFRKMSDFEIKDYVSRYEVTKFAGAFDPDGMLRFAEEFSGNYNLAGLPVNRLVEFLRKYGVKV